MCGRRDSNPRTPQRQGPKPCAFDRAWQPPREQSGAGRTYLYRGRVVGISRRDHGGAYPAVRCVHGVQLDEGPHAGLTALVWCQSTCLDVLHPLESTILAPGTACPRPSKMVFYYALGSICGTQGWHSDLLYGRQPALLQIVWMPVKAFGRSPHRTGHPPI